MPNIKTCEHEGCLETFDIDKQEGIIVTKLENKTIIKKYYCCIEHKNNS